MVERLFFKNSGKTSLGGRVVIIAGTGVSISACRDIFRVQIESGDAEFLVLQNTVGALEPQQPEILESLAALPCVFGNADGLFEKPPAAKSQLIDFVPTRTAGSARGVRECDTLSPWLLR
jgi:hypothetical protein